ncbi:MAG: NusG domain II-containing protein [Ruminococcaceae bacterium]|nr:NusG domain II-containing protein [Oscillospiraceae bacterium]
MKSVFSTFTKRNRVLNDLILLIAVLFLALCVFFVFKITQKNGNTVTVTVDGEVVSKYPLDTDIVKEIKTASGNNTLIIKDGKAFISNADCPDKLCAKYKPISKTGESIICLPHKLAVTVESNLHSNGVDMAA